MRPRILATMLAVAGCLVFPPFASAAPHDLVAGAGILPPSPSTPEFGAWSLRVFAVGTQGRTFGRVSFDIAGGLDPGSGDVQCLAVDGSDATLGVRLTSAVDDLLTAPQEAYNYVRVFITDVGPSPPVGDPDDHFSLAFFEGSVVLFDPQDSCKVAPGSIIDPNVGTIVEDARAVIGNFVVHDAP